MVIPKIAICPICNKKTYLRIEDGGYLKEYPIRVNCMNCRTLIKGVYIMDVHSQYKGLHLLNADITECDVDSENRIIRNADYVAEISGELPCKTVRQFDGHIIESTPFLDIVDHIDSVQERIDRLSYFARNMSDWKRTKSTAFQLLDEGSIEYIATALNNKIGKYKYECNHYLKSLHCLQEIVIEETKYLFVENKQEDTIKSTLRLLSQVDSVELDRFIQELGGVNELIRLYKRSIEVFSSFMNVYPNLLPAETYLRFSDKNVDSTCISTCSFGDVKSYYQDAYEILSSLLFIPVCIDNIVDRSSYSCFSSDLTSMINKKMNDYRNKDIENELQAYQILDNGIKISKLSHNSSMQKIVEMPANSYLRNGIGHNNYSYDGITQQVIAYDLKNPEVVKYSGNLMDVAVSCIGMARTAVCIAEIILFLLRKEFRKEKITSIIHPSFYKHMERNDSCPCGSNIRYKNCCKNDIDLIMRIENKNV